MPLPFLLRLAIKNLPTNLLATSIAHYYVLIRIMKNHKLRAIKMGADC
ncbi:MAG: hypothetical protein BWY12_01935 [candidate division BRC1 bacterium ADurb.Bin183]|nr:MAG: hypothetical protein BWY12_01935 [candidate division BRC1 bacterium ADurb.Bin183]